MKKYISATVIPVVLMLFCGMSASGQDIVSLPQDPLISNGVLPDGVEYYLVSNGTKKGLADLSLVWKLPDCSHDTAATVPYHDIARKCLVSTSIFSDRKPESFLRDNAVFPGKNGYIEFSEDALAFRFRDVNLSGNKAVLDSLLMMIFDIAGSAGKEISGMAGAVPGQAVIVSGDIDRNAVLGKMKLLSLFVPHVGVKPVSKEYRWESRDSISYRFIADTVSSYAVVNVECSAQRIPEEYMNTVLPLVSRQFGEELGIVLKKRIYKEMRKLRIPLADVSYRYAGSRDVCGDETYSISVVTARESASDASDVVFRVLSDIGRRGASLGEYSDARADNRRRLEDKATRIIRDNPAYVDKCIASFIYGASLASDAERLVFFDRSEVSDSTGRRLFNNFAAALLGSPANMSVTYMADPAYIIPDRVKEKVLSCWSVEPGDFISYAVNKNDTLGFVVPQAKVKVQKTRTEPVSGGTFWTFSNGMQVVYKKMPTGGMMYYSLLIRGGLASIPGLEQGEGAFIADMLRTYDICGLKAEDFRYLLSGMGVTMVPSVGVSNMRLSGTAPADNLGFLMKTLLSVAEGRTPDKRSAACFMADEQLRSESRRSTRAHRYAVVDSLFCPDSRYSVLKTSKGLDPDLPEVADSFFKEQFSKANDGVLVLVGDMNELEVKKILSEYIGGFSTVKRTAARPRASYQTVAGESTYTLKGRRPSVDVAMTAGVQLTASNYMAAAIAAKTIEDEILRALDGVSSSLSVYDAFVIYPNEKFNMMISVDASRPGGYAYDTVEMSPLHVLFQVRSILKRLSLENIADDRLKGYRDMLKNEFASLQSDPEYWVSVILRRFADGKDLNTDYAAKVDAVTSDHVREIISSLENGGKVELVMNGK